MDDPISTNKNIMFPVSFEFKLQVVQFNIR